MRSPEQVRLLQEWLALVRVPGCEVAAYAAVAAKDMHPVRATEKVLPGVVLQGPHVSMQARFLRGAVRCKSWAEVGAATSARWLSPLCPTLGGAESWMQV